MRGDGDMSSVGVLKRKSLISPFLAGGSSRRKKGRPTALVHGEDSPMLMTDDGGFSTDRHLPTDVG